jgi:putative colanic acid biosynthesis UDP-glucose lipid carrier transferase
MLFTTPYEDSRHTSMASKYTALFGLLMRVADPVLVACAGVLAYWVRFGSIDLSLAYERALARGMLFGILVFAMSPLYRSWRGRGLASELATMTATYTALFVLGAIYITAFKYSYDLSRLWRAYWFIALLLGGTGMRIAIRGAAAWIRRQGIDVRTAVVIGSNRDAVRIVDTLRGQPWIGIRPLGRFDIDEGASARHDLPSLGTVDTLADYVETKRVDQVWIALPMSAQDQIARILDALAHSTATIKFVPDLFGMQLLNHSVEQMAGLPVINLRASPFKGDARVIKALEDRALALLILFCIAPLLAFIALGIKLTSPGPILFRQKRHGLGGQVIEVWKFRSMRVHFEGDGHVTQATRHDPRVTAFGRFLRRTSLDELPQFCNVLHGTMSIVGPRPHALAHNHHYSRIVDDYMQRHRIKPGITGWAQVNGLRGEIDNVEKMRARVQHDLFYMQNWSLGFDLKIIAMTVVKGFFGRNAY